MTKRAKISVGASVGVLVILIITVPFLLARDTTKTILIQGMTCDMCINKITNTLKAIDGVQIVSVELGQAVVKLNKKVSNDALKTSIKNAGYTVTAITTGNSTGSTSNDHTNSSGMQNQMSPANGASTAAGVNDNSPAANKSRHDMMNEK